MKNLRIIIVGFLMGIVDTIPGVSGSTVAYIGGLYPAILSAIHHIASKNIFKHFTKTIFSKHTKLLLLLGVFLIIGAIFGLLAFSTLLDRYYDFIIALVSGLIISTAIGMTRTYVKQNIGLLVLTIVALAITAFVVQLEVSFTLTYLSLFIIGFAAIAIMLLPGVSGAYFLLVIGQYQNVATLVRQPLDNVVPLLIFALGGISSFVLTSKLLHVLMQKHKRVIHAILSGVLLGSLAAFNIPVTVLTSVLFIAGLIAGFALRQQ